MNGKKILAVAAWATAWWMHESVALAEPSVCGGRVTRSNLTACALSASLDLRSSVAGVEVLQGRRTAVSPILPSNPTLSFALARRSARGVSTDVTDWYATLQQELEIGGQRGLRRDEVDARIQAQTHRVDGTRRDAAAAAWVTYFEVLAADEEVRLSAKLSSLAQALSTVAAARAEQGLTGTVDADLAHAGSTRLVLVGLTAERHRAEARAKLGSLLGLSPEVELNVEGALTPLAVGDRARSLPPWPEILTAESEKRAATARAGVFRRTRVPNPTLSVFVQNDGFDERVYGAGVSLPIPTPGLGRVYSGEIAESEAEARRLGLEAAKLRREQRLALTTATDAYASRLREAEAFPEDRLRRAEEGLSALNDELRAGRLSVRDALVAEQTLIEFLLSSLSTRRALCLASVELARVTGLLPGGDS